MLHYIILGVIEGLTEFLPISSTGHMILYNYFSGVDLSSTFLKTFEISVQLGAVLAVVFYYYKDLIQVKTIRLLIVGVFPTLIIGFLFKNVADRLLEYVWLIALNLILGGLIILFAEYVYKNRNSSLQNNTQIGAINYRDSFVTGVIQSIAMMPGVSRSGAIIVYGLFRNYQREVIAKHTFLLAVPTMVAATGYSLLKNYKIFVSQNSTTNSINISVGFVTSFIVALFVIRYALPFIKKYSFVPFAYYRIVVGLFILSTMVW